MKLELNFDYLKEMIGYESSSLVRKISKRFEIIDNKEVLKAEIKELIYEEMRHVRDLLLAGGRGLEQKIWTVNNKETC